MDNLTPEQEAERLYPADSDDNIERLCAFASQAGYRDAARMYLSQIDDLKKECELKYKAGVSEGEYEIERLKGENLKMREALESLSQFGGYVGTLATEALKTT